MGILLKAYTRLLQDAHKHVRKGAHLHLGTFLSTFNGAQVPTQLVSAFLSMATDDILRQQMAFQFPAIVLALGAGRWSELREGYLSLSRSDDDKVRQTLAASLHEVAEVLGPDHSEKDLLPVLDAFMNDTEGVSLGVTKNLAAFLEHVGPSWRETYLPVLKELLERTASMKWRSREALCNQLSDLAGLYAPPSVHAVLAPLASSFLRDSVAQVRLVAIEAVPPLLKALASGEHPEFQVIPFIILPVFFV